MKLSQKERKPPPPVQIRNNDELNYKRVKARLRKIRSRLVRK